MKVIGNVPEAVGVPLRTPVAELNVTPGGSVPLSDRDGIGKPLAITVNDPKRPDAKFAPIALLMIAGG